MKLYEKKFPIYENCMISIFGQPGNILKNFFKVENFFKADRKFYDEGRFCRMVHSGALNFGWTQVALVGQN